MYATFPFSVPVRVWLALFAALAMPKSTTLAVPLRCTSTLSGEMSRCTSPSGCPFASVKSCAYCRPDAAIEMILHISGMGRISPSSCARLAMARRLGPSMNSIAMK